MEGAETSKRMYASRRHAEVLHPSAMQDERRESPHRDGSARHADASASAGRVHIGSDNHHPRTRGSWSSRVTSDDGTGHRRRIRQHCGPLDVEALRATTSECSPGSVWTQANGVTRTAMWRTRGHGRTKGLSSVCLHEATDRFATVASRASQLVVQLTVRPRRFAAGIPFVQERHGIRIRQPEATYEPAAHAKGVHIAMLTSDSWRYGGEVAPGPFDPITRRHAVPDTTLDV